MSKLNDDTCNTFAVSTLEPSLHKGCNSPSVERLYSPLFVLNPKGTFKQWATTSKCSALGGKRGLVQ